MQRGLDGRRIALLGSADPAIAGALENAGATVARVDARTPEDQWHSGLYAALVVAGSVEGTDDRARQLVREFLVADKPVGAIGDGLRFLRESGTMEGRKFAESGAAPVQDGNLLTASEMPAPEFASALVRAFTQQLEERQLDEMSDASFPASDPPAVTPSSVGASREPRDAEARGDSGAADAR